MPPDVISRPDPLRSPPRPRPRPLFCPRPRGVACNLDSSAYLCACNRSCSSAIRALSASLLLVALGLNFALPVGLAEGVACEALALGAVLDSGGAVGAGALLVGAGWGATLTAAGSDVLEGSGAGAVVSDISPEAGAAEDSPRPWPPRPRPRAPRPLPVARGGIFEIDVIVRLRYLQSGVNCDGIEIGVDAPLNCLLIVYSKSKIALVLALRIGIGSDFSLESSLEPSPSDLWTSD